MNASTTKSQVRSDWQYSRELMRDANAALTSNDLDVLAQIAPELIACATTLAQYLEERGHDV